MSNHTPGPWKLSDRNHVYSVDLKLVTAVQHGVDTEANARLIAAAPELLEALQKFVAWSEAELNHEGTSFWERIKMLRDLDDCAAAAIAKATGEKS